MQDNYADAQFWILIGRSLVNRDEFVQTVKAMNKGTLARFCWGYQDAASFVEEDQWYRIVADKLGGSEDIMKDFGHWVVERGEIFYSKVIQNSGAINKAMDDFFSSTEITMNPYDLAIEEYLDRYDELPPDPSE